MNKLKAALQGNKIHTTKFTRIGSAFPTPGKTREDLLANLEYAENEVKRWANSIAFVEDGYPAWPTWLDWSHNFWNVARGLCNNDNASTINAAVLAFISRIASHACTIVRNDRTNNTVQGTYMLGYIKLCEVLRPFSDRGRDAKLWCNVGDFKIMVRSAKYDSSIDTSEITWTNAQAIDERAAAEQAGLDWFADNPARNQPARRD